MTRQILEADEPSTGTNNGIQLEPYKHQVAGHGTKKDGLPNALVDAEGNFYKPLQADERGDREATFYQDIANTCKTDADPYFHKLSALLPRCGGTIMYEGRRMLILEDLCRGYAHPCVLDIKMGFRTWYPWADPEDIEYYKVKDATTTQSSLGFRLCGLQVYDKPSGTVTKRDSNSCKALSLEQVLQALASFFSNGDLVLAELLPVFLDLLAAVEEVFQHQTFYHFYSSSLLFIYDGAAATPHQAKPSVRLVDCAHVFPAGGEVDQNFLKGLQSLIHVLQKLMLP